MVILKAVILPKSLKYLFLELRGSYPLSSGLFLRDLQKLPKDFDLQQRTNLSEQVSNLREKSAIG